MGCLENILNSKPVRLLAMAPFFVSVGCASLNTGKSRACRDYGVLPNQGYHASPVADKTLEQRSLQPESSSKLPPNSLFQLQIRPQLLLQPVSVSPSISQSLSKSLSNEQYLAEKYTAYLTGLVHLENKSFDDAMNCFEHLLDLEQDSSSREYLNELLASAYIGKGTRELLYRALNISKDRQGSIYLKLGILDMEEGNLDDAKFNLNLSLQKNPFIFQTYLNLREIYTARQDWQAALGFNEMARNLEMMFDPYGFIDGGRVSHYDAAAGKILLHLGLYSNASMKLEDALQHEQQFSSGEKDELFKYLAACYFGQSVKDADSGYNFGFEYNFSRLLDRCGYFAASNAIDNYAKLFGSEDALLKNAMAGVCNVITAKEPTTANIFLLGKAAFLAKEYNQAVLLMGYVQKNIADMVKYDTSIDVVESYIDKAKDVIRSFEEINRLR